MPKLVAGAASRFTQREYGGLFTVLESDVAVALVTLLGAGQDPDRITLLLVNNGTTNLTVSTNVQLVSGTGILLLGNGSSLSLSVRTDGDAVGLRWNVISDLAGGLLHVVETTLVAVLPEETE